jgi:hypothetical protein
MLEGPNSDVGSDSDSFRPDDVDARERIDVCLLAPAASIARMSIRLRRSIEQRTGRCRFCLRPILKTTGVAVPSFESH